MDRLLRAIAIGVILFLVVFAFVIGSRVDQATISLLSGTVIGVLVAAPCAIIITWLVARRRDDWSIRDQQRRATAPFPTEPPQFWVVQPSQALPPGAPSRAVTPYPWNGAPAPAEVARPRRRFFVIGENGDSQEVVDDGYSGTYTDTQQVI